MSQPFWIPTATTLPGWEIPNCWHSIWPLFWHVLCQEIYIPSAWSTRLTRQKYSSNSGFGWKHAVGIIQRVSVHFFASVISGLCITDLPFASCPYHRMHSSSCAQPPFSIQIIFIFSLCVTTVLQHTASCCAGVFSFTLSKTGPACSLVVYLSQHRPSSALKLHNARSPLGNTCMMLTE